MKKYMKSLNAVSKMYWTMNPGSATSRAPLYNAIWASPTACALFRTRMRVRSVNATRASSAMPPTTPALIEPQRELNRAFSQLSTILEILASVSPMTYGTMADLLASEAHRFSAGSTLVLVTAVLPDALIETLEYLATLGHRPLIIHLDDEEPPPVPEGLTIYWMGPYFAKMESPYAGHAE